MRPLSVRMHHMDHSSGPVASRPAAPRAREPVLKTSPRCPTCGRQDVVTFRPFFWADAARGGTPPLVCLACAPRAPAAS